MQDTDNRSKKIFFKVSPFDLVGLEESLYIYIILGGKVCKICSEMLNGGGVPG